MPGQGTGRQRLAGKIRGHQPKNVLSGVTYTNKDDYTDGNVIANMFRGFDPTYAIPRDAINSDLRLDGSPFVRIIGDEFVSATESFIWLGATKNLLVGGGPLTENNGPTYTQETTDDESALWEFTVGNLVSSSSQYWNLPTASAVQVGTNSFMTSIAFKSTTSGLQYITFYGDLGGSNPYWGIYLDPNSKLTGIISDGTHGNPSIQDPIGSRWLDGRWHIATLLVDRTLNLMYLLCDGQNMSTPVSISSITGTLTLAGSNLLIGASNTSGTKGNFFNGNLALCKLINNVADYNVPQVWNMGIQVAVSSGTYTTPAADSNKRLNNKFGTPNTNGAYFYETFVCEDGEYEIQAIYEMAAANGQLQIIIDGNPVVWLGGLNYIDTYNGSTTHNNTSKAYGFKLGSGRHLLEIFNSGKNASSSGYAVNLQYINLIKRRGHEFGGLINALLLGDEINERNNAGGMTLTTNTGGYYNIDLFQTTPGNSQYTEGTIFLKGGYYRVDVFYGTESDAGKIDLWIGDVQILSQLDTYGGTVPNNLSTKNVRLQQGKNNIRIASNGKNASSSNYYFILQSIKLERLSD